MRKYLLILVMLLLPTVIAVSINDTIYTATTSNTSVTFNVTRHADSIIVESTGIYFQDYRLTDAATERITFNITESNATNTVNTTRVDLPYYASSATSTKIVSSNLTTLSTRLTMDANCNSGTPENGNLNKITVTTPSGVSTDYDWGVFDCNGDNTVNLTLNLQPGNTTLGLTTATVSNASCNKTVGGLMAMVIAISFGILVLIFLLFKGAMDAEGGFALSSMELRKFGAAIMVMVSMALILGIMITVLSKACSLG